MLALVQDVVPEGGNLCCAGCELLAAVVALAGGPLVGAVAFIAQKILKDPLNKVLTSEYRIIGTWEKPEEVNNSAADKIKTTIDNTKNLFNDKK